jgi:glycosyltransferase
MKISIITVALNSALYIEDCIKSVVSQAYNDVEHIIVDGGSTDGTLEIIQKHKGDLAYWVSEPDKGLYDAMNKGINAATGDVIGILNSDDFYINSNCLSVVANCLAKEAVDSCYADLIYVDENDAEKGVRYWRAGDYDKRNFKKGWMPPHPTFFVKRKVYEKYGLFNINFPLAADYELMLRFLYKNNVSTVYIPEFLVKMRTGGACRPGLINTFNNMQENYHAWRINGLRTNPITFLMKPLSKTLQYTNRSLMKY